MEASLGELLLYVCRELDRGQELLLVDRHFGRKGSAVLDAEQLLRGPDPFPSIRRRQALLTIVLSPMFGGGCSYWT